MIKLQESRFKVVLADVIGLVVSFWLRYLKYF